MKDKQCENLIRILIEEKELSLLNFKRLRQALIYRNTELVTSDGDLLLTVDSLITLNNIITGPNNLFLRSVMLDQHFIKNNILISVKLNLNYTNLLIYLMTDT